MILPRAIKISLAVTAVLLVLAVLRGVRENTAMVEREGLLMGTIVRIKAPIRANCPAAKVSEAIGKAFDEMARVEAVFSAYKADSEISKINRLKPGEALKISGETFTLIEKAVKYGSMTGGAFDITVKPFIDIWTKAKAEEKVPLESDIALAMTKTGLKDIQMDAASSTISLGRDGMAIDLGGVAKGYAVDRAIKVLKANGVKSAIVHAGGDMYCLGFKSGDKYWTVGIQHPRKKRAIVFELAVKNKSVDTSGDYERYFMVGSRRYSHIIDPRTGLPIGDDVVSVTVIADDPATGDIFSTALCVLGEGGLRLAESEGLDAVMITKKGSRFDVSMTQGFKERYSVKEKSKL